MFCVVKILQNNRNNDDDENDDDDDYDENVYALAKIVKRQQNRHLPK